MTDKDDITRSHFHLPLRSLLSASTLLFAVHNDYVTVEELLFEIADYINNAKKSLSRNSRWAAAYLSRIACFKCTSYQHTIQGGSMHMLSVLPQWGCYHYPDGRNRYTCVRGYLARYGLRTPHRIRRRRRHTRRIERWPATVNFIWGGKPYLYTRKTR